jgi:hypothetical protein
MTTSRSVSSRHPITQRLAIRHLLHRTNYTPTPCVRCTDIVISTLLLLAFYDFIYVIAGERDSASRGQEIRSFFRGESFSKRSSPLRTFPASSFVLVPVSAARYLAGMRFSALRVRFRAVISSHQVHSDPPDRIPGPDDFILRLSSRTCSSRAASIYLFLDLSLQSAPISPSISLSRASLPAWHGKVCCVTCV